MAKGKSKPESEQADSGDQNRIQLEEPITFQAMPVEHRAMQWTGENYEALRAFTGGAVELHSDGRTLGVQTTEGYVEAPVGHYICEDSRGHFYPCDPEVHEAKYAVAGEDGDAPVEAESNPFKEASPRQLIDALINRIGRVEAVRGVKYPPLRVMAQELRDSKQSMDGHPALDEKRL